MINLLKNKLTDRLKLPLPGENAQFQMAPVSRERLKEIDFEKAKPKKSAILVLIFPHENKIKTVLIERPTYQGVHSGQISFPGGKFEERDIQLHQTALREAKEEIGITPETVDIIGNMTNVYITPSNFLVTPYIGFINETPLFKADSYEVAKIITPELFSISNPDIIGNKSILQSNGYSIKTPFYNIEGYTVWGATAMMISELNALLNDIK